MVDSKMIDDVADWISNLSGDQAIYSLALRHDHAMRKNLKSANKRAYWHGLGIFLEYYVYELLKTNLANNDKISLLVKRGSDLPKKGKDPSSSQEDGIGYSQNGEIKIYGNGADLAEIDIIMMLTSGEVILCEVVHSGNNLAYEHKEFRHKKLLLSHLFSRDVIGFLVSGDDLSRKGVVQEFLKDESNRFVLLKNPPKEDFILSALSQPNAVDVTLSDKLLELSQLEIKNKFDFRSLLEETCNELLNGLRNGSTLEYFRTLLYDSMLNNLYLFEVESKYWFNLFTEYTFKIKDKSLTITDLKTCSKMAIIGLSLRHLRPTIYLKVENKIAYLKFTPAGSFAFKLEGSVPHSKHEVIPALRGHIRVAHEDDVDTAKDFIKTFYRDELRNIKNEHIPDDKWIQSLCPSF